MLKQERRATACSVVMQSDAGDEPRTAVNNYLSTMIENFETHFCVEASGRSLEEINLLFAASSPFVKTNEKEFALRLAAADGNVAEAERALTIEVDRGAGEWSQHDEEWQAEKKASSL